MRDEIAVGAGHADAHASVECIEAISFDLDDTLWQCAPVIANAEAELYRWHQEVTPKIVSAHTPDSLLAYRMAFRAANPALQGCVTAMRLAGLRVLLDEFGYPESLADEAFQVFYRARSEVELYEGAEEMLATLQSRYRLAAITNGNADLDLIGIARYFDVIIAADLSRQPKPNPQMFKQCLTALRIPEQALLHIGDNPVADISGGHNAGVQTLWFNQYNAPWPDHLLRPHFQARTLSQIVALLAG